MTLIVTIEKVDLSYSTSSDLVCIRLYIPQMVKTIQEKIMVFFFACMVFRVGQLHFIVSCLEVKEGFVASRDIILILYIKISHP